MPNEDIYYEASKIMITGLISAVTMLGSESIKNFLLIIPGFNALLFFPIPFTEQTICVLLQLVERYLALLRFFIWINGEMILK